MSLMNCFAYSMLSPGNAPAIVFNPHVCQEYLKKIPGICCAGLSYEYQKIVCPAGKFGSLGIGVATT